MSLLSYIKDLCKPDDEFLLKLAAVINSAMLTQQIKTSGLHIFVEYPGVRHDN